MEAKFPIALVAQQTGLSVHVIRVWERRYGVVSPDRADSRRRLYTEAELKRLGLMARLTRDGHRIGDIAKLEDAQLEELCTKTGVSSSAGYAREVQLDEALDAVAHYDSARLESFLDEATLRYGQHGFLARVVGPLAYRMGEDWSRGLITAAHEHHASHVIRTHLLRHTGGQQPGASAPLLISATPAGQLHELGAAIVAAAARDMGWRVDYLGANLPAAELAGAVRQRQARCLSLSLVHPTDDASLGAELRELRRLLPQGFDIFAGGRAASCYRRELTHIGARICESLEDLYEGLAELRLPKVAASE